MVLLSWYSLLIPVLVFIFFLHQWFFINRNIQKKLPPSPRKLPIIGNLHQLGPHPHRSLHKLSKQHGPVMLLHLGSKPVLVASSVDAARDIMKTNNLVWSNRPKSSIADRLFYGSKDVAFSPYGEYWRQVRNVTVLHLLSSKRVQSYRNVRDEETSNMIENIRQECNPTINLRDILRSLTSNIISRVALGRKYNEGESGINAKATLDKLVELLGVFNIGDYIPWLEWVNRISGLDTRVEKVAKELDIFLEMVIEEHITRNKKGENRVGEAKDFVDVLLEIQNGKETGFPLQRDSLKAIVLIHFKGVRIDNSWDNIYRLFQAPHHQNSISIIKWIKPPILFVKLNSDGSCSNGRCGGGGVVRNPIGQVIMAYSIPMGYGTSNWAEAEALLFGLIWCTQRGYNLVVGETDSLLLANAISGTWTTPWKMYKPVKKIQRLVEQHGLIIRHCYREANQVADKLASLSHHFDAVQIYNSFAELPRRVRGCVNMDKWQFPAFRKKKIKPTSFVFQPP